MKINSEIKEYLLNVARTTIKSCVSNKKIPEFKKSFPILKEKCGAFVTLHKNGELRGCIGYIEAYKPLLETVVEMAESAALRDNRFPPVTNDEVNNLEIEISVLSPLKEIQNVDKIIIGKHGIVISKDWNKGLLLPQVATEHQWNKFEFIENTCLKAGLEPNAWKDPKTKIEIFSAEIFSEKDTVS